MSEKRRLASVAHAKGSGAHGFFEVTEEVTQWTSASFLSTVGKRTPVFARFSTLAHQLASPDTVRGPRGFTLKFYTEEGNYDLVGNNTPVSSVRDATKFRQWDLWTLSPETAHQVTMLMSDRGTPRTFRNMNGYGSHTYLWMNAGGERFWVKYHFKTAQGIENFTNAEAAQMVSVDPDYHRRDLWNAIENGDDPEWRLEMQIMPCEDAAGYRFNPFDLTKVWPHADYPPITIGRLVLDRNPGNHLAEVEQATFAPSNLVPGIELGRYAHEQHADDDDFIQAGTLYRDVMNEVDRNHLASNIVAHASDGVSADVEYRVIDYWTNVDAGLGERLTAGLGHMLRAA